MSKERTELSEEEIKEMRLKMNKFYKEEIPLLRMQRDYQKLISEISGYKLKHLENISLHAAMISNSEPNPENEKSDDTTK